MKISNESYLILILAVIIPNGLCLQCFQCNSAEHPACSDVIANDTSSPFLLECTGEYENQSPFCRKVVTKVLEGSYDRVVRSCGWILDKKFEREDRCRNTNTDFILKDSCVCFSDMCNGSKRNGATFWILPASLIVPIMQCIRFR